MTALPAPMTLSTDKFSGDTAACLEELLTRPDLDAEFVGEKFQGAIRKFLGEEYLDKASCFALLRRYNGTLPRGEFLLRLRYFLRELDYLVSELEELPQEVSDLGYLIALGVIARAKAADMVGYKDKTLLGVLLNQTNTKFGKLRLIQEKVLDVTIVPDLDNLPKRTVKPPARLRGAALRKQEQGPLISPPSFTLEEASSAQSVFGKKQFLQATAQQVIGIVPVVTLLASGDFTAHDRAEMRRIIGATNLLALAKALEIINLS